MEYLLSFIIAVMGGVVCHYIIKWLDDDDQPVTCPGSFHPQIGKEIPRVCYTLGISLYCPTWTSFIFLPVLNIAYAPGKVKFMHSAKILYRPASCCPPVTVHFPSFTVSTIPTAIMITAKMWTG